MSDSTELLTQLREELRSSLDRAISAAAEIQKIGHLPHPTFMTRLQKLYREIAGGPTRRGGGARGYAQQDDGPMVDILDWCRDMIQKIQAFQDEYMVSHSESPSDFPRERTSGDWSQELMMFTPSQSASSDDADSEDADPEDADSVD